MLHFIKQILKVNNDFSVVCLFNTNETRLIDLSGWVEQFKQANDGWASRIADINYFKTVKLDSYGTLMWDNELDFCPDVLYEMSTAIAAYYGRYSQAHKENTTTDMVIKIAC